MFHIEAFICIQMYAFELNYFWRLTPLPTAICPGGKQLPKEMQIIHGS